MGRGWLGSSDPQPPPTVGERLLTGGGGGRVSGCSNSWKAWQEPPVQCPSCGLWKSHIIYPPSSWNSAAVRRHPSPQHLLCGPAAPAERAGCTPLEPTAGPREGRGRTLVPAAGLGGHGAEQDPRPARVSPRRTVLASRLPPAHEVAFLRGGVCKHLKRQRRKCGRQAVT